MNNKGFDDRGSIIALLISVLSFITPFIGSLLAVISIIMGHYYWIKNKGRRIAIVACILGYISIIFSIFVSVILFIFLKQFQ